MSTIINGTTDAITFPDATIQNTSAIVSGKVPYTNLPAGSVLQVVQGTYATETSSSSNVFADTGLTATITPKFATSKILVVVSQNGCAKATTATTLFIALLRSSSIIAHIVRDGGNTGTTALNAFGSCSIEYLDSPATTSATTYKTQYASQANTGTVYLQSATASVPPTSTITLMEIAQ